MGPLYAVRLCGGRKIVDYDVCSLYRSVVTTYLVGEFEVLDELLMDNPEGTKTIVDRQDIPTSFEEISRVGLEPTTLGVTTRSELKPDKLVINLHATHVLELSCMTCRHARGVGNGAHRV